MNYVPNDTDNVVIADVTNQPILDTNHTVNNLTINSGATSTLDLAGHNLTLTGTFSNDGTLMLQGGETLTGFTNDTNSGTVEYTGTTSYTGLKAGNTYNNLTFNGSGGSWTLNNDLTVNGATTITAGTLDASASNYNVTTGTWSNSGTFTPRAGTLTLTNTGTFADTTTLNNFTIDSATNNKTITLGAALTATGAVTISTGDTLDASASNYTVTTGTWSNSGTFTPHSNTLTLTATGIFSDTTTLNNFAVNASGKTVTLGVNLTVTGATTITAGTLDASASNYNITAGTWSNSGTFTPHSNTLILTNSGTFSDTTTLYNFTIDSATNNKTITLGANLTATGAVTISTGDTLDASASNYNVTAGTWSNSGAFTPHSNTLTLTDTGTFSDTTTLNNFTIDSSTNNKTITLGANLTATGAIAINTGDTLDVSASNYNITTGTWSNSGTFTPHSNTLTLTNVGTFSDTTTLNNFTIDSSTNNKTITLGANLTATGAITINTGDTLDASASNYNISTGTWSNSGTFTPQAGTLTLTNTGTFSDTTTLNNFTINANTKTITLGAALNVGNNLTITAGTLDASASNYAIAIGGNFSNAGAFTSHSNTVTFNKASSSQTLNAGSSSFYNLTHSGAGTLQLVTSALTVTNNFTNSGGTFDANGLAHNVAGTFNNTATYTANNNTVTLNGTNQSILGSTTFYNLIKTVTSAATLTFEAAQTQIIAGALTLQGAANQLLSLLSSIPGTEWFINPQGAKTVSYVKVQDSHNNNASAITAANSQNVSNNTNWTFSATTVTWTGTTNTDWGTSTNWDVGYVPNATDNVIIADVTNQPILDANHTANNLTINSGATDTLDLAGHNLTLTGTFSNNGTLMLQGNETLSGFTNDTDSGTVTYTGTTSYTGLKAGNTYYNLTFNGSGGAWTLNNDLTVNGATTITAGTLDASASNYGVSIAGNWSNAGTFTPRSGTVTFNGSTNQTFATNSITPLFGLTLNNSGPAGSDRLIISGNLDVNGTLTVTDGNLYLTTNNPVVATSGDVVIATAGSVTHGTGLWTFDGVGTNTLTGNTQDLGNVTVDGTSKTVQLGGAAIFNTLTIGADDIFSLAGYNAAAATLVNNNIFQLQGGETVSIAAYDIDSGITNYIGSGNYATLAAGSSYYNLTFNGSGAWTAAAPFDVNGNLTITAGTFNDGGKAVNLAGNWTNAGTYTSTGLVIFDGANQSVTSGGIGTGNDFAALTKSGTGTLQIITNGLDIDGTLTISSGTTLDLAGQNLTSVATLVNNGTLQLQGGETVGITTYDTDSGLTKYVGSSSYAVFAAGNNYYDLVLVGSGSWNASNNLNITHDFTLNAGTTLDLNGHNAVVAHTFTTGGTLRLLGTETTVTAPTNLTSAGTVIYDNTSTVTTLVLGNSYHDFIAAGTGTITLPGTLTTAGNLTVNNGATLNLNGHDLAVSGNFLNLGTLNNASGRTLTLNGVNQTLTPGSGTTLGTVDLTGSGGTVTVGNSFSIANLLQIAANKVLDLVSYTIQLLGNLANSGLIQEHTGAILKTTSAFYIADSDYDIDEGISLGSERLYVSLMDQDGNLDGSAPDTLTATVSCATDSETLTLTETGNATMVFRNAGGLATELYAGSATPENGTLTCSDGAIITASYIDPQDSSDSATDTATATLEVKPTAPTNFAGTMDSTTSLTWTWTDTSNNEAGFKIYNDNNVLVATIATSDTVTYTETGLDPGTSYTRKVVAYNLDGNSGYSNTATVMTKAAPTPTPTPISSTTTPTTPSLQSPANGATITTTAPTFTFKRSAASDGSDITYSFILNPETSRQHTISFGSLKQGATATLSQAKVTAGATNFTLIVTDSTLLTPGAYTWEVKATDANGNSSYSATWDFTVVSSKVTTSAKVRKTIPTPTTQPLPLLSIPKTLVNLVHQSMFADLATHPLSIADVITQINQGLIPVRAPIQLQLPDLAKQAQVRLEKQAINLQTFLENFVPTPVLAKIDQSIVPVLDRITNLPNQLVVTGWTQLANLVGLGRDQLAALNQFMQSEAVLRQQQQRVATQDVQTTTNQLSDDSLKTIASLRQQIAELQQQAMRQGNQQLTMAVLDRQAKIQDLQAQLDRQLQQFTASQQAQIQNLLDQGYTSFAQARDAALNQLQGWPRLAGKLAVQTQQGLGFWERLIIAARTNRLQLAAQSEQWLNSVFQPASVLETRFVRIGRYDIETLQGKSDENLQIAGVGVAYVNPTEVQLSWITNRSAKGKVNWGETTSYGANPETGGEVFEADFATTHSLTLKNLKPSTRYYFEVLATDLQGQQVYDSYYTFTTNKQ